MLHPGAPYQQSECLTLQLGGSLLSTSIHNFHSGNLHILVWSLPREIISAPLLFSGSLLYGGRHQLSSKKQFRRGAGRKGGIRASLQTCRAWG